MLHMYSCNNRNITLWCRTYMGISMHVIRCYIFHYQVGSPAFLLFVADTVSFFFYHIILWCMYFLFQTFSTSKFHFWKCNWEWTVKFHVGLSMSVWNVAIHAPCIFSKMKSLFLIFTFYFHFYRNFQSLK